MKKILVLLLSLLTFGLNAQGTKLKIKQLENPGTSSLNLGANSFSAGAQSTISTLYVPNTATVGVLKIDANGVYNYGNSSDNSSIFYGYREGVNYYSGIENAIFGNNTATLGTTGNDNCFFGASTARSFTAGSNNCVFGSDAMVSNTNGASNIAIGTQALLTFTNSYNIGIGTQALRSATSGSYNLGLGYQSLYTNSTATANTGIGHTALYNTTTGSRNTAIGYNTGLGITTGSANTILGANVTGLAAGTTKNIILSNGDGEIKYRHDGTNYTLTSTLGDQVSGNSGTLAVLSDVLIPAYFRTQSSGNPADATTYYFGVLPFNWSTEQGAGKLYAPYNMKLVGYDATFYCSSTLGSAGNSTLSINISNVATSLNTGITMVSTVNNFTATGLSIDVNSGQYVEAKLLTPTWTTNPSPVFAAITFWFVRRQ